MTRFRQSKSGTFRHSRDLENELGIVGPGTYISDDRNVIILGD